MPGNPRNLTGLNGATLQREAEVGRQEAELRATRDRFAESALCALLPIYAMQSMQMKMTMAASELTDAGNIGTTGKSSLTFDDFNHDEVATEAYLVADAMMRARDRKVEMPKMTPQPGDGDFQFGVEREPAEKPCLGCIAAGLENGGFRCKVHTP